MTRHVESTDTFARLDNRSVPCATGLIAAARAVEALPPGTVLEILTRDRFAPYEVAVWAGRKGHELIRQTRAGVWPFRYHRLWVRRGAT
ncbi:MAG: sulfurtransferase TusA family protein [Acidimicrobiia bacterium]|nr:sulfurtransferase TusA family protein [Acidimicrobiia bacterium]